MSRIPHSPELLAPAGDWEAMLAAVANGADAVYFGLSNFNARARAANFTLEELPEVMRFLHARNVRGFVTLNTLIFSDELEAVATFVKAVAEEGADAVIVQDLGLVRLIKRIAPTLPVHASTQMTLTEPRGIDFVTRLGVDRVVLARELSLADIQKVTANTTTPVEVFVHGALCVAYSGQCLTSEALGGRSANRGQCAQACRLPYEMIVDGTPRELGDRAYLLSPQDLAAYDLIDPLIEAGVISFKIEGRLKGGPYVAATTQTYRKAIDAKLAHHDFTLPRREQLDLAQTFSRGLTPGFLEGVNHQKLVRGRFPKSRGIRLGRVTGFVRGGVRIELCEAFDDLVKPGDGVLFDIGKPEEKEPAGRVWTVTRRRSEVELHFEAGAIDFSQIHIGCDVYKTDDPALRKRLEQSYVQDKLARRVSLTGRVSGVLGGSLTLALSDGEYEATATWAGPLELARKQPTSTEEIREQLSRLGDTPFELGEVAVDLPARVMVPRSVLNDLRRQVASELAERRLDLRKHAIAERDALAAMRAEVSGPTPPPLLPAGRGARCTEGSAASDLTPPAPFLFREGGARTVFCPSRFRHCGGGAASEASGEGLSSDLTPPAPFPEEEGGARGPTALCPSPGGGEGISVFCPSRFRGGAASVASGEGSEEEGGARVGSSLVGGGEGSSDFCPSRFRGGAASEASGEGSASDLTPLPAGRGTGGLGPLIDSSSTLTVLVRSLDQLDAVLAWTPPDGLPKPAAVYCDFEDLRRYKDAVPRARAAGTPIGLATLRIWKPSEDGFQALVARAEPDIVLVRNLASIGYFQEHLPNVKLIGDFSLNVANELTADVLMRAGLERLVPSYDLNWDQFASMLRQSPPEWYEPVIHQHMPMFHMEHCVFAAFLSTGKDHRDCGRPCEIHKVELRDRVGANFPVLPDTGCRNTVFNSVAQSGAEYVGRMRELGIMRFRIDLLRETPEQVRRLLTQYARVIAGLDDGRETWRKLRALNQLGVTRGTLNLL